MNWRPGETTPEKDALIQQLSAQKEELEKRLAELGGDNSGRYLDELFESYIKVDLCEDWKEEALAAGKRDIGYMEAYVEKYKGTVHYWEKSESGKRKHWRQEREK